MLLTGCLNQHCSVSWIYKMEAAYISPNLFSAKMCIERAFVSCGYCKKLPQTGWLKNNRNIFSHNFGVQKSEISINGPKSRHLQSHPQSGGCKWRSVLASSNFCWHSLAWGCIPPISASIFTSPSPFCLCAHPYLYSRTLYSSILYLMDSIQHLLFYKVGFSSACRVG